jgi:hypothetical protein
MEGDDLAAKGSLELEVLLQGIFEKPPFLDLVRSFIVLPKSLTEGQDVATCTLEPMPRDIKPSIYWKRLIRADRHGINSVHQITETHVRDDIFLISRAHWNS